MPSKPLVRVYALLAAILLAGGALLVHSVLDGRRAAAREAPREFDLAVLAGPSLFSLGRDDAPTTIVEFADFQCPGCAAFAARRLPRIIAELVEPGLARYVFVEYPLPHHAHATLAARAARCAAEHDAYWPFHHRLYAAQAEWSRAADAVPVLVGLASDEGIEAGAFEGCLRSERHGAEVEAARRLAVELGVRGTPALSVDGVFLPDAFDFDDLAARVRAGAGAP